MNGSDSSLRRRSTRSRTRAARGARLTVISVCAGLAGLCMLAVGEPAPAAPVRPPVPAAEGRVALRRLNRFEYENTLRDLLSLPQLDVGELLPEDGEAHGFNKVSDALDVSHVQMAAYLDAAPAALNAALAAQVERPEPQKSRYYARDEGGIGGKLAITTVSGRVANRGVVALHGLKLDPDQAPRRGGRRGRQDRAANEAVGILRSSYRPFGLAFTSFTPAIAGRYRLRVSAYGFSWDQGKVLPGQRLETLTLYAGDGRQSRRLGSFDVPPNEPRVIELDVWLSPGEVIRPDAALLLRGAVNRSPNMPALYTGPGLALQWLEVEGPLYESWPPAGHRLLFGDLPLRSVAPAAGAPPPTSSPQAPPGRGRRRARSAPGPQQSSGRSCEVVSTQPLVDAERLLRGFMPAAYRRSVREDEVQRYLGVVKGQLTAGQSFTDAMIAGYTAVLCSPGFLYLAETPGQVNDQALAARLSYFLWNSAPDAGLMQLASRGELGKPESLRAQTERLLNDPRSRRFVESFLDYWLDLREIRFTEADPELYPEYTLDDLLVESILDESREFFTELLRRDLSVVNLVHSDFAMLNERLARHYGIPGVTGVDLRRVTLPPGSPRGGILTQASVLKVTSNGTTTSPVLRGAWVLERILGQTPPPPPPGVPGLEPDTRGATTIRQQLAQHRSLPSCAGCHALIDPPGFALESFDVMGGWRTRYRTVGEGEPVEGVGHTGRSFTFRLGPQVDSSGEMADGRAFQNVQEFKRLLLANPDRLAGNMTRQLVVYATGAGIQNSDRRAIGAIVARGRGRKHGLRTLIHEVVQSDIFRRK